MPLPDPHADEMTVELDEYLLRRYREAAVNADGWTKEAKRYRTMIEERLGSAFAATVNGEKVITYRPTSGYASSQIQKDYPELTQHYMRPATGEEFDLDLFVKAHPEIAEQYRIRSFRNIG